MKRSTFWWLVLALLIVRVALMALTPVFEPSEARYAAISANMARSGDFVVPRFTHDLEYQSFDGKPPLVFQAGGVFCRLFGITEFSVRLFPLLSAILLLVILHRVVRREAGDEEARLATLVAASCTAFYAASGLAMTDMSLTCCVAGALLLYREFLARASLGVAALIAALLGAGMIVKGPVALVMFGLPAIVDAIVNRRGRGIFNGRWLVVAPIFLLVAVPWFVLVEQRNPGSVKYFFYNENLMRFISHDYGDRYGAGREAFFGVSIVWAFVATLPWALLLPVRRIAWRRFELLAALSIVGFWCLTSRVLIYYLFPMIPLFAVYLAHQADRARLVRCAVPFAVLSMVVLAGTLVGGMVLSDKMRGAETPFVPIVNHYAYEFYHGRRPESELEKYRAAREEFFRRQREAEAQRGEAAR